MGKLAPYNIVVVAVVIVMHAVVDLSPYVGMLRSRSIGEWVHHYVRPVFAQSYLHINDTECFEEYYSTVVRIGYEWKKLFPNFRKYKTY